MEKKLGKSISIALSGGGARGIVHLGMIQVLKNEGYEINAIAGTSIGALVGCLISNGMAPLDILSIFKETKISTLLTAGFSLKGLISMEKFVVEYEKYFEKKQLEDLPIPMYVATTNLSLGETSIFSHGSIGKIVAASCCVPGIFQPIQMDGQLFVDGGITQNLPVDPLLDHPWPVVGFHCNAYPNPAKLNNVRAILEKSSQLSIYQNSRQSMKKCFAVFDPTEMSSYSSFDFNKADTFFEIGYHYMCRALSEVTI